MSDEDHDPPRRPPEEWPIDRTPRLLEEKLAPISDFGDWNRRRGEEMEDRLGEDGFRLLSTVSDVKLFMRKYDMTPEEAIKCLEHEIAKYREGDDAE